MRPRVGDTQAAIEAAHLALWFDEGHRVYTAPEGEQQRSLARAQSADALASWQGRPQSAVPAWCEGRLAAQAAAFAASYEQLDEYERRGLDPPDDRTSGAR